MPDDTTDFRNIFRTMKVKQPENDRLTEREALATVSSAVLIWVPDSMTPSVSRLDQADMAVEPFWLLSDACKRAQAFTRKGFTPWVKAGASLLSLSEIKALDRTGRELDAEVS